MAIERFPPEGPGDSSGRRLETSATGPRGIAPARRAATEHLQRCGCSNVDDAVLVLSELVTNAVVHADGADRILVACDDVQIHISVHDQGTEPARLHVDLPAVGGSGLRIVDKLADAWGSKPLRDGKDVWAILPRAPTGTPAAGADDDSRT